MSIEDNVRGILCDYCGRKASLESGRTIYPHRRDLWQKRIYVCGTCKARVGCHGNTDQPLGRLADAALRAAKIMAHAEFDKIWKARKLSRTKAYRWLATHLEIPPEQCHIGQFDVDLCNKVVDVCRRGRGTYTPSR